MYAFRGEGRGDPLFSLAGSFFGRGRKSRRRERGRGEERRGNSIARVDALIRKVGEGLLCLGSTPFCRARATLENFSTRLGSTRIFPSLLVVVVVIVVVVDRREMFVWVPVVSSGCSRRGRPFKCLPWFGFNEEC